MKSILSTILAFMVVATLSAQPQGQLTLLKSIGERSKFKHCWGITKNGDSYSAENSKPVFELKFENNLIGTFSDFSMVKEGTDEKKINSGFGFLKPDHYTEPSFFYVRTDGHAYVYVDGLMYYLKGVNDPKNITNIDIEEIYYLLEPKTGTHTSGKAASKAVRSRNHETTIRNYLDEMKKVQEQATANFSSETKDEIVKLEEATSGKKAADKAKNDAFWASDQGQKVKKEYQTAGQTEKTIHNTGKNDLIIMVENGFTHKILGGSKKSLACDENVYYAIKKNDGTSSSSNNYSKGNLISGKNQNCGQTISAAN